MRLHHKRGFIRQRASYYDSGRIRRAVFALWRLWAQSEMARQELHVAEARRTGLLVRTSSSTAPPWWETEDAT